MNTFGPLPLTLYVHLPWCERKCPYCDFNSHPLKTNLPESDYIDGLIADLEAVEKTYPKRRLQAVFFGGGTPSLFEGNQIARLLERLDQHGWLDSQTEITLEANPGSAEADRFRRYRDCGVNRLSLGVQSFNNKSLSVLGRIHNGEEAKKACRAIREAGFDNFNIDLMHGLPGQATADALADLRAALDFSPTHLSLYQLTIEPNTAFAANPPVLPDEEVLWDIRCVVQDLACEAGFEHYEVAAFARPGYRCRHNLNYWEFGDYIGIGAGAHSKLSVENAVYRWSRPRHPREYLKTVTAGTVPDTGPPLTAAALRFEFLLNALRLEAGFEKDLFAQRTGLEWKKEEPLFKDAANAGLLHLDETRVQTTPLGWRFLDDLLERFLDQPKRADVHNMMLQ